MAASEKRRSRWKLVAAGLVFGLGLDTVTLSSRRLMGLAVVLMVIGAAWFVHTLLRGGDGLLQRKRREILLALATALVTTLLIVALAVFVRVAPRHLALDNQSYDAALGWAPPDVPGRVGQRGQSVDDSRDHVVVIGDSIMYGHGVGDNETGAYLLEGMLGGEQVLNLAVSGYSLDQDYIYLKRVLPTLRAKLVIVGIFTGNDYEVTGLEYGWGHTKPMFELAADGSMALHNRDLLADNCIDHLAQSLLFRVLWGSKERALDLIHLFCDPAKLGPEELEQVISNIYAGIEEEAAKVGARVLFVLLPLGRHLKEVEVNWRYFRRYNRLRELLREGGHEYVDFYRDILAAAGPAESDVFLDGAHYTPNGHRILAESLAGTIRDRGLLGAVPPAS